MEELLLLLQASARLRWQERGTASAARSLGSNVGDAQATHLMGRNLASSTQSSYQENWEAFRAFCLLDQVPSLPATPVTVACYIGHIDGKGTVRGGYIRPYLAKMGPNTAGSD